MSMSSFLEPANVTVLGKSGFADVMKDHSGLTRWALDPNTSVIIGDTHEII